MTREGDQKRRFQMERKIVCQEIGRAIQYPFSSERLWLHWNQSVQHGVGEPCVLSRNYLGPETWPAFVG